jgi:hypothetical protein
VAKTDANGLFNSEMGNNGRGGITQSGVSGNFTYASRKKGQTEARCNYHNDRDIL